MQNRIIDENDLKKMLNEGESVHILDLLPPEYFNEKHIKGAKNAPVYEVDFLGSVEKITSDRNSQIVVYSEWEDSYATKDAKHKLSKAGFVNVMEFPGGLQKWESAGFPVEKGEQVTPESIEDGKYEVSGEKSLVRWIGRNFKYAHNGTISLKKGELFFEGGKLTKGKITLDMESISDTDLADEKMKKVLENHLKSSDFFDVEVFPEASFDFESAKKTEGAKIETSNYNLSGMLTIKDVSRSVSFDAMIVPMPDGKVNGQAHFDFDRTLWNVRYGSEKFFEKLGMHLVDDSISLDLFFVAEKGD